MSEERCIMGMKTVKRACIYCHTYSAQLSCDTQITICTKYIEQAGWELVEMYVDEGVRVEFKRLLNDTSKDIFDLIVTQDMNRITLEHDNLLKILNRIKPVEIVFIDDKINTLESIEPLIETANRAREQRKLRHKYSKIVVAEHALKSDTTIKTIIKHARSLTGLTQKEICDKVGITKYQYIRLERGERDLSSLPVEKVVSLLEVLNITPEAIKDCLK